MSGPVLSRLWTEVHEIFGPCRRPVVLSSALARLSICHVSFSRYSPLSVDVVENPNKCESFLAPNFPGLTTPTVLQQIVSAMYTIRRLAKFG